MYEKRAVPFYIIVSYSLAESYKVVFFLSIILNLSHIYYMTEKTLMLYFNLCFKHYFEGSVYF